MEKYLDFLDEFFILTLVSLLIESFIIFITLILLTKCIRFLDRKRKKHVEPNKWNVNNKHGDAQHELSRDVNNQREANTLFDYLQNTYWKKKHENLELPKSKLTHKNLKPVLRISKTERKIHIVYSKKSLWNLAFSEKLEGGLNEKFGFIFKGLKSWSVEETHGRFANVLQDLLEFRQEIRQELLDHQNIASGLCKASKNVAPLRQRSQKIKEPKSILTVCDYSQEQDVVYRGEQLDLTDNSDPYRWKVAPPSGLELQVPSVCFVIPAPDAEATELATRIEIQYKHLLTLWKNRQWHVKQALNSSEVFTTLKVLKGPSAEKIEVPELISSAEEDVDQLLKDFEQQLDSAGSDDDEGIKDDLNIIAEQFLSDEKQHKMEPLIFPVEEPLEQAMAQDEQFAAVDVPMDEAPMVLGEKTTKTSVDDLLKALESINNTLDSKSNLNVDSDSILEELDKSKVCLWTANNNNK